MTTMHRRLQLALATLVAIAASVAGTLGAAAPAHAATSLTTCTTNTQMNFSPGLTLSPHAYTATGGGTFALCLLDDEVESATFSISGSGYGSCLSPNLPITMTVTWNDHSTSVAALSPVSNGFVIDYLGTVTSGRFNGATVELAGVGLPTLTGGCLPTAPLTGAASLGTISFISL